MSEQNKRAGKRQVEPEGNWITQWWRQHCAWVDSMSLGQLVRYRILQVATVLSILVIALYVAYSSWVKIPELPNRPESNSERPTFTFHEEEYPVQNGGIKDGRKVGVYTFLVAGKDVVSGSTDTMLLVSYDTVNKTLFGLNLPRDTMLNVSTTSKRLNSVYSYNRGKDKNTQTQKGMAALKEAVRDLTGIMPDFYVMVEWEAIGKLVDALGGVEFEVPFDMDYDDPYQDLYIHQKAGLRLLSGDDAMQVIRHRKNNDGSHSRGDVGRLEVQQDFLKAVAKKCLQPATFLKLPDLAKIFKENVETDLTIGNLLAFVEKAAGMDPEHGVNFTTAPFIDSFMYKGASLVTLDGEAILELVNEHMNPYAEDITLEDLELLVRRKDGSFYVTSGTLAERAMAVSSNVSSGKVSSNSGSSTGSSSNAGSSGQTNESKPTEAPDPSDEPLGPGTPENGSESEETTKPETQEPEKNPTGSEPGNTTEQTPDPELPLPEEDPSSEETQENEVSSGETTSEEMGNIMEEIWSVVPETTKTVDPTSLPPAA